MLNILVNMFLDIDILVLREIRPWHQTVYILDHIYISTVIVYGNSQITGQIKCYSLPSCDSDVTP